MFKDDVLVAVIDLCFIICNLLKSAERSKDGASNPNTIFPLRWGNHFDFHAARGEGRDLFAHAIGNAREHSRATTKHNVAIQIFPNINITLHNGVISRLMNAGNFHADHGRLEKDLRAPEPLSSDRDHLAVR